MMANRTDVRNGWKADIGMLPSSEGGFMTRLSYALVVCAALIASTSVAQTDNPAPPAMNEAESKAYTEAYEKAFRTAFRVKSVNQCIASATNAAAAGLDITPTCACFTETLLATKSLKQLQELNTSDPNNEELTAVVASCLKSDPPWAVGQQPSTQGQSPK